MSGADDGDDDLPGWTDVHIHPVLGNWALPIGDVGALAAKIAPRVLVAAGHSVDDQWDAHDDTPPPLFELELPEAAALGAALATPGLRHVHLLLDVADTPWADRLEKLATNSRGEWQACTLSLGWGRTSIPDLALEETMATFCLSLCLGGPGWPGSERAAKAIIGNPMVQQATAEFAKMLGVPCTAHLSLSEEA